MSTPATSAADLLVRAEVAWGEGDGESAMAWFGRAAELAEAAGEHDRWVAAVLGLARGQAYNLTPGLLAVRLHAAYEASSDPGQRIRLAAALARCWAYANAPDRARPFASTALGLAEEQGDPALLADALDATLATHWGPDELAGRRAWALRLDDSAAHLADPDARLQAHLWSLTVAWEVLDLPRMHRAMRAVEQLAEESPRAEFFAASRRLPLELLRGRHDLTAGLVARAEAAAQDAVIPDAWAVLHEMRGYAAFFAGDVDGCAAEAVSFEEFGVEYGVVTVRAEAVMIWMGAERPDKVTEMLRVFTADLLDELPRDSDWLLVLQCVLEGAVHVGDAELAERVVTLLAPYAGRSVVNAGAVQWHGVTDDTLGRAFALLGDQESAERHRAAAIATYERIGAAWWRDRLLAHAPAAPITDVPVVHLHPQPGGLWLVGREGATFVLPHMKGLDHLHALVRQPDTEIRSATLVGEVVDQGGIEVLDEESVRFLRRRVADIERELEVHDLPDLRAERDAVVDHLHRATGMAGRRRTTGSHDERARVAVRKAIVAALAKVAETDPWLGRHLHDRVHTGIACRYETDPDRPVRWVLG
ncbi:hypothetical protein ASC77_12380 [Nocardioides sp. Root1257]|uniref:hypothetical protein n=1 Tax=unclassified Nocardioides TaxID=2615069 RepID=UPI0006FF241F|nr:MULTISPECIES: hypothetical protein [unclassified Nocardioides]KQW47274.1 hypothetical protein ASC77_12380 [Nocardioides sp. Root1257]KRC45430.1 hypothetical protein ASE24_12385 [Nocardioides sp. Root224]